MNKGHRLSYETNRRRNGIYPGDCRGIVGATGGRPSLLIKPAISQRRRWIESKTGTGVRAASRLHPQRVYPLTTPHYQEYIVNKNDNYVCPMKFFALQRIEKPYFGVEDIANALGIALSSAKTAANRYTKQGILLRIKNNMYVTRQAWVAKGREEKFLIANYCQVPSYLSLMTALDYFEITTQVQKNYFESIAIKRSKEIAVGGTVFRYVKLAPKLYGGFKKEKKFFIATPEKALLDAFYLMSYGRYALDLASLDPAKLDRNAIERLIEDFPLKTKALAKKYGYL